MVSDEIEYSTDRFNIGFRSPRPLLNEYDRALVGRSISNVSTVGRSTPSLNRSTETPPNRSARQALNASLRSPTLDAADTATARIPC